MGRLSDEMYRAAKPDTSASSEKHASISRLSALTRLIQLSRSFRGLSEMEPTEAAEQAATWNAFGLDKIPDADLADAFIRALENFDDSKPFGGPQVCAAWNDIRRERAEAIQHAQPNAYHQGNEVTFAEWFSRDREWIAANLTPDVQAMMTRLFDKRAKGVAK